MQTLVFQAYDHQMTSADCISFFTPFSEQFFLQILQYSRQAESTTIITLTILNKGILHLQFAWQQEVRIHSNDNFCYRIGQYQRKQHRSDDIEHKIFNCRTLCILVAPILEISAVVQVPILSPYKIGSADANSKIPCEANAIISR